ncbi:MAG: LytTR family DNA-binding domain-containing protein, partial [Bacteroidota bacterium]
MNAIIVDDEKKGREILHKLIKDYCPEISVQALAANADQAYELIKKHKPDILFLDIEMPGGDGFYLLEKFQTIPFQVIFTTAYDNYAIQAIKHQAFDYLLKPIDIDELKATIANVKKSVESRAVSPTHSVTPEFRQQLTGRIALPVQDGVIYLIVADILRIESDGSYSVFYTSNGKKHIVSKNLKVYEDLLPATVFFRVHKSHLINMRKVKKYLRTDGYFAEMEDNSIVEISRRKKDEFLQRMNSL